MGNLELYEKLVTLVYALYYFMISGKFASSMDTLIKNGRKSGSRIRNDDITKDLKKRKREIQECTFDFMMKLAQIKLTLEYLYTGKQSYDSACEYIEAKHKSKGLLEAEKCCNSLNEKLMVSQKRGFIENIAGCYLFYHAYSHLDEVNDRHFWEQKMSEAHSDGDKP